MFAGQRRQGRSLRLLAVLFTLGLAALAGAPAQADRLSDARAEADRVQADLEQLDVRLSTAVEEYNQAQQRLEDTEAEIAQNTRRLGVAKGNLTAAESDLSEALVAAYRNGQSDVVELLLGAQSLDQMLDEMTLARRSSAHTRDVIERVRAYRGEVERRGKELRDQRAAREKAVSDRAAQKAAITGMLAERKARLAGVRGEIRQIIAEREAAERAAARARARAAAQELADQAAQPVDDPDFGGSAGGDGGGGGGGGGGDDGGDPVTPPPSSSVGAGAASVALSQLGVPYVWGGASPSGFDCSGLVTWAFAQAGMGGLPHSTYALWGMGSPVSRDQLEPGDLVFFYGLGHMGIYIGGGQFVHAPHTGDVVKVSDLDGYPSYDGARRVG